MKIQAISDILLELVLISCMIASLLGYLAINPAVILCCIVAIYCISRLAKSIELDRSKTDKIEVKVIQEAPSYFNSGPVPIGQFEEVDEDKIDINGEVLAQIHGRRLKESLGQSNINHQEHESDGHQTMESLKALQGIKDADH